MLSDNLEKSFRLVLESSLVSVVQLLGCIFVVLIHIVFSLMVSLLEYNESDELVCFSLDLHVLITLPVSLAMICI